MVDVRTYLGERKKAVESFFGDYFGGGIRPAVLKDAMLYSLCAGGKRIRPILALAAYESFGRDFHEIVPYAAALELIHTYSLIHDDLPAMDDDDLRRGKPTNHKVFGEANAILAGDALMTEAFRILADTSLCPDVSAAGLLRGIFEVSSAAGCRGMVAGQVQDMLSEDSSPDAETLRFIHEHKTAALIRASVRLGALLAGGRSAALDALDFYGRNVGLAFQIIDDILDVEGETHEIGKTVGSDERGGKMTFPALYGIERSKVMAEELLAEAVSALDIFAAEADPLRGIAAYLLGRRN